MIPLAPIHFTGSQNVLMRSCNAKVTMRAGINKLSEALPITAKVHPKPAHTAPCDSIFFLR